MHQVPQSRPRRPFDPERRAFSADNFADSVVLFLGQVRSVPLLRELQDFEHLFQILVVSSRVHGDLPAAEAAAAGPNEAADAAGGGCRG